MTPTTHDRGRSHFPFLRLPKDIRLIVYEQLPIVTRHSTIRMRYTPNYDGSSTLILRLLPLAILRVCWTIYHEAYAMLKPKMFEILTHPSQIIIPGPDLSWMRDGFARFLRALQVTRDLPGPATLRSDMTSSVHTTYVSPEWSTALHDEEIPVVVNPSLVQWLQQANLHLGNTTSPISLASPTAKSTCMLQHNVGIQILIRQTNQTHRCPSCYENHVDLQYTLREFLRRNLAWFEESPRVDVSLLVPTVNDTALESQWRSLLFQTVESLGQDLEAAFGSMSMQDVALHAHPGEVVDGAAWKRHWQLTRDGRVAEFLQGEDQGERADTMDQ
jgi:hypothetical protein